MGTLDAFLIEMHMFHVFVQSFLLDKCTVASRTLKRSICVRMFGFVHFAREFRIAYEVTFSACVRLTGLVNAFVFDERGSGGEICTAIVAYSTTFGCIVWLQR